MGCIGLFSLNSLWRPNWFGPIEEPVRRLTLFSLPFTVLSAIALFFARELFPVLSQVSTPRSFRTIYLDQSFFILRGIIYILGALWFCGLIWFRKKLWAAPSLILLLMFGSLASYDWVLSISPQFHSTIFGLLTLETSTLITFGLAVIQSKSANSEQTQIDVNNVHFALIALWGYLVFMQYLTVWSGNLPVEAHYFTSRISGAHGFLAIFVLAGQLFIPIPLLLFKKLKRSLRFTHGLAGYSLFLQMLNLIWMLGANS